MYIYILYPVTADGDIVVEVAASKPVRKVGRPKKCAESFPKIEGKHPHQEAPSPAPSTQKMEPQITTPEKAVLSDADSCLVTDSTKITRVRLLGSRAGKNHDFFYLNQIYRLTFCNGKLQ